MPATMPPRKKKDEPAPSRPSITFRPAADVAAALDEFRRQFGEYPPALSQVIDRALRAYLRGKGYDLPELPESE